MRRIVYMLACTAFFMASCSDDTQDFDVSETNDTERSSIYLEKDSDVLFNSIDITNRGAIDIRKLSSSKGTSPSKNDEGQYSFFLAGQVTPPSLGSVDNLGATHVDLVGNYAYVSYNSAGAVHTGTVDVIDVTDYMNPFLVSRLYFEEADINAVTFDAGHIYVAGSLDAEKSEEAHTNSFVGKVKAPNGQIDMSDGVEFNYQDGFVANDIMVKDNSVYVTSGKEGYITRFDKNTLEIMEESPFDDLRSLSATANGIAVLDGSFGVRFLDTSLKEISSLSVTSNFGEDEKRTIAISDNRLAIAEGSNGAGIYNIDTGALETKLEIALRPEGELESDIVTNAVSFNDDLLLMANGAAGLSLAENKSNIATAGVLDLQGSINYVVSKDDYIFAASGRSGLQIIRIQGPPTAVTGISVTPEEVVLLQGRTKRLVATVSPLDATNKFVNWSSSDDAIVSVDENGNLSAISEGTVTITATTVDGGLTDTAQVKVLTMDELDNIALNKKTKQSSTGWRGVSARAVDGNQSGVYRHNSITHTLNRSNSWWRVDLGTESNLAAIRIFNRSDCCSNRLNGFKVYVGNTESNNPNDYIEVGTLKNLREQTLQIDEDARYVLIHRTQRGYLSLAEVEVFGIPN
ncbi:MAG: Ig-like domain-containing protein [Flavobacteriaceae bacterium]